MDHVRTLLEADAFCAANTKQIYCRCETGTVISLVDPRKSPAVLPHGRQSHGCSKEPSLIGRVENSREKQYVTFANDRPPAATEKELLDAAKGKLGILPNVTEAMATSPVVLESYLNFSGALGGGLLEPKTREKLAMKAQPI